MVSAMVIKKARERINKFLVRLFGNLILSDEESRLCNLIFQ
jgi:hypothetical protein